MQDQKMADQIAGHENAGPENGGPSRNAASTDMRMARQLQQLMTYVQQQWIDRRTVGPDRLSVREIRWRTNNVLESYHAALRRRIQVSMSSLVSHHC